LFWQIGKRIGILELLRFDTRCGELSLSEMELDSQYLLIRVRRTLRSKRNDAKKEAKIFALKRNRGLVLLVLL
jgi:hypothetical protein